MRQKICGKCKKEKKILEFGNNKSRKDGKQIYCLDCSKEISKEWREENIHLETARKKEYYEKNKKDILKRMRKNYDPQKRRVRYLVEKKLKV